MSRLDNFTLITGEVSPAIMSYEQFFPLDEANPLMTGRCIHDG